MTINIIHFNFALKTEFVFLYSCPTVAENHTWMFQSCITVVLQISLKRDSGADFDIWLHYSCAIVGKLLRHKLQNSLLRVYNSCDVFLNVVLMHWSTVVSRCRLAVPRLSSKRSYRVPQMRLGSRWTTLWTVGDKKNVII